MRESPSFGYVLGLVWKVLMALLLIPFLILLTVIAIKVVPGWVVTGIALVVLMLSLVLIRRSG